MLLPHTDGIFHMWGAKIGKIVNFVNNFKKQMFRQPEKSWLNQFSKLDGGSGVAGGW
jgi:hypothetical protein